MTQTRVKFLFLQQVFSHEGIVIVVENAGVHHNHQSITIIHHRYKHHHSDRFGRKRSLVKATQRYNIQDIQEGWRTRDLPLR